MADNNLENKVKETSLIVEDALRSIADKVSSIFEDAASETGNLAQTLERDITKSINALARTTSTLESNQSKLRSGLLKEKDIRKQIEDRENKILSIRKQIEISKRAGLVNDDKADRLLSDALAYEKEISKELNKQLKSAQKIDESMGLLGKTMQGLNKTFLGRIVNSEEIEAEMRKASFKGGSAFLTGIKAIGKGITKAVFDPISIITFFITKALQANKESVNLSKNLGLGEVNANKLREHFVDIESSTNNLNITTKALAAAQNQIADATGYFATNNDEALQTQIMLTEQFGLTAEEASNIYKFSVLNKTTSKAVNESMVGAFAAAKNQLKVNIPFKATMAEAAKVSGQLASNLKNNPSEIVKAVVASKALGTSLEQAKNQGATLLDFQSSIENELKAELITGEKLNLERARAYALAGDQVGVARELANQGMTSAKFNSMNVIAQDSYAKALGLTSDELANQLTKRELARKSGESLAQQTKRELLEAQQRQDVQEKFNKAIEKLQSIVGNLVAGPLGSMLESLSTGLLYIDKIASAFGKVGAAIRGFAGDKIGGKLGELASVATIGTLIFLVSKSMLKGTILNPMITKDVGSSGGGGGIVDTILGKKSGGQFKKGGGRVPKGGRTGGIGKGIGIGLATGVAGMGVDYLAGKADEGGSQDLAKGLRVGAGALSGASTGAMIGSIIPGLGTAVGAGIGGVIGGGMAAFDEYGQQVQDGIAKSGGPFQIRNKYGQTAVTAAGDKLAVSPNISGGQSMDLSPMIDAINQVTAAVSKLEQKSWNVNLDSKAVGTGLMQKTYRSA
jgi:hypothetical protein